MRATPLRMLLPSLRGALATKQSMRQGKLDCFACARNDGVDTGHMEPAPYFDVPQIRPDLIRI